MKRNTLKDFIFVKILFSFRRQKLDNFQNYYLENVLEIKFISILKFHLYNVQ